MSHLGKVVASRPEATETTAADTPPAIIKVGDRVTGYENKLFQDRLTTGVVSQVTRTILYLEGGRAIWLEGARLDPLPTPTVDTSSNTTENTPMSNTPALLPSSGKVDFNKPIRGVDNDETASVFQVLPGSGYYILVVMDGDNYLVDEDGEDRDGNQIVENLPSLPNQTFYAAFFSNSYDDAGYSLGETLYSSYDEAKDNEDDDDTFIGVIAINPSLAEVAAPVPVAAGAAPAPSGAVDGEETRTEGPQELNVYISGYGSRLIRVGDMLRAKRKGFGIRTVEVKQLRHDRKRSVEVQANDGTGAYWALNENLSIAN